MAATPSRRPRLQFSIAALLLLMVPVACGADVARRWWQNRPLQWEEYSAQTVQRHLGQGQTVLLHFTADWNANVQVNERFAVDVRRVRAFCREHQIASVKADWTNQRPEIRKLLLQFNSLSIPLTVIIPAATPDEPIVLRDMLTQQQVLEALEEAVERQ